MRREEVYMHVVVAERTILQIYECVGDETLLPEQRAAIDAALLACQAARHSLALGKPARVAKGRKT